MELMWINIASYIDRGSLVPAELISDVIKAKTKGKTDYIIDGYPRSIEQIRRYDLPIDKVIYITSPMDVILKRLTGRRTCENGN